jgi:peptide chain release factor
MIALQISSGRGPAECELAVAHVARKIMAEGPGACLVQQKPQSAIVTITGTDAEAYARSWIGTILWVCALREHGRKNWYVGINAIELPESGVVEILDDQLKWETMRSSGKGGQHANKTESAVRLTHLPTQISVVSEDERSQHRNKQIALSRLKEELRKRLDLVFESVKAANWSQHNQLERGNPIRVFEGKGFREKEGT